jgi:clan AA aspartic protease (TIGR02281 family)
MAACLRLLNLVSALACASVAACQSGGEPGHCDLVHVTDVPVTVKHRKFFASIKINGQDVPVIFDTGATDNLITESTARRLGMSVHVSGYDYIEGIGGTTQAGEATSQNVRIGDAHGEKLKFTTVPDGMNFDEANGLLGMNFLNDFDLDLDFWEQKIGLYRAIGTCDAPYTAMAQPLYAVDLTTPQAEQDPLRESGQLIDIGPAVTITINGVALRAEVDTGSFQTVIFRDSARRAGLLDGETIASSKFSGIGPHEVRGDVRMSAPIVIGDLTLLNVPVVVADQRHWQGVDVLLGYDFVTMIHLWISKSSKTLIMQYPPRPTPSASPTSPAKL